MNIWIDIPETNGNYSANKIGEIKSNDRYSTYSDGRKYFIKGRLLAQSRMSSGYLKVTFSENQKKKQRSVSRIIAELFVSNPNHLKCVCHKNDIKTDNRAENLFWGTHQDNTDDMIKKGRKVIGGQKLKVTEILEIKKLLQTGVTQQKIADIYNVKQPTISDLKNGRSHSNMSV